MKLQTNQLGGNKMNKEIQEVVTYEVEEMAKEAMDVTIILIEEVDADA